MKQQCLTFKRELQKLDCNTEWFSKEMRSVLITASQRKKIINLGDSIQIWETFVSRLSLIDCTHLKGL